MTRKHTRSRKDPGSGLKSAQTKQNYINLDCTEAESHFGRKDKKLLLQLSQKKKTYRRYNLLRKRCVGENKHMHTANPFKYVIPTSEMRRWQHHTEVKLCLNRDSKLEKSQKDGWSKIKGHSWNSLF